MALLNEAEKKSIEEAVGRAEQATAGELRVVVAGRSADYGIRRGVMAVVVASVIVYEVARLSPELSLALLLLGQAALWFGLFNLFGVGPFLRSIVPKNLRSQMAERRAMGLLVELGITETRDRSGVLIFLSEAEHQVVILADSGINQRVEPGAWQRDVDQIVASIRQGQAAAGVLGAVERIGGVLANAFPPRADDTNELSDAVVEV